MKKWSTARVRELARRLEEFRRTCRVTTLVEEQETSRSPFRLLVACVISLRTKDEVTAESSRRLFALADNPEALAALEPAAIAGAIFPAGFYNTKAKQLREIAQILQGGHGGAVPADETALLALPGVGRKTANLVLGLGLRHPGDLCRHPRSPHLEPARAGFDRDPGTDRIRPPEGSPAGPLDPDQRPPRDLRSEPLPPDLTEVQRLSARRPLSPGRRHALPVE